MATTFQGATRQFGSSAGIGAFALRVGCTAIHLLKKLVDPFVKHVGQNVLEAALPEVVSLIQGKKKFKRAIEDGTKSKLWQKLAPRPAGDVRAGGGEPSGPQKNEAQYRWW